MKSIEIWNKGWEKLYAYIASFCTFVSYKWKIFSILSLLLVLLFLPVDNSYAQYNIEITPVSKTWVYDGTEHGQDYEVNIKIDGKDCGNLKSEYDDQSGRWSVVTYELNGTSWKRGDCTLRILLVCLIRKETSSSSTLLTIEIPTRITDVGTKNVVCSCKIEQGSFEREIGQLTGYVYSYKSTNFQDITDQSNITINPATYTVIPRPLTINCIDAKEWDGNSECTQLVSNALRNAGSSGNLTYQYSGLVSGEYVSDGAFKTSDCTYGTYTYGGNPSSVISIPFEIKKANGTNSTDNYDITYTSQQRIVNREGIISRISKIDHVSCYGEANGMIYLEIKNYENSTSVRYQYQIGNGSWQTVSSSTFTIDQLPAGEYIVKIKKQQYNNPNWTDIKNQNDEYSNVIINQPSKLTFNVSANDALCFNSNGLVSLSSTGGTSPYTYSIDGTNFDATYSFEKPVGTYTVYVKDANNCQKQQQVTISQPAELSVSTTPLAEYCKGISANLSASATGGTTDYTYAWSPADYLSATDAASVSVAPEKDITYTVTVTDANGCTAQTSAEVKVAPLPAINCKDYMILSSTGAVNLPLPEETSGKECSWSVDNGFTTDQNHITGTVTPGTSKTVKISATYCQHTDECDATITVIKEVGACETNAQR